MLADSGRRLPTHRLSLKSLRGLLAVRLEVRPGTLAVLQERLDTFGSHSSVFRCFLQAPDLFISVSWFSVAMRRLYCELTMAVQFFLLSRRCLQDSEIGIKSFDVGGERKPVYR